MVVAVVAVLTWAGETLVGALAVVVVADIITPDLMVVLVVKALAEGKPLMMVQHVIQ
jgi:hypothetical protein